MPNNRYPLIAREAWPFLVALLGLAVLAEFFVSSVVFFSILFIFFIAVYLLRDPYREIPSEPLAVVSPAYGVVTLIEEAEDVRLKRKAMRIQVTMRAFDVYSLRSPIEGKVAEHWCSNPDKNEPCRHFDLHIKTDEGDDIVTAVRLKDIIRKFHFYMHLGERVGQGQRSGYLYLGGLIDVFIPLESKVLVEEGQYVKSGSTVLAQLIHQGTASVIKDEEVKDEVQEDI
jgi:phosphatidylserine decarboxylase